MPAWEDEHGTYIMNSKDLRAIQHVRRLIDIGVSSLKIEGRTKSHFYVARTAQAYRQAIDDSRAGRAFDMGLMSDLEGLANRGYTEGFYRRHLPHEMQAYEGTVAGAARQQFVGEIVDDERGRAMIDVKNRFAIGDELELMSPGGNRGFRLENPAGFRRRVDLGCTRLRPSCRDTRADYRGGGLRTTDAGGPSGLLRSERIDRPRAVLHSVRSLAG